MTATDYLGRIEQIRRLAVEAGVDALLITHLPNVFYLCGFSGSAGVLLVGPDRVTLFTDGRYAIQARQEARHVRVRISRGPVLAAVGQQLQEGKRMRAAFEPAHLSVAEKGALQRTAGRKVRWLGRPGLVEELRAVKDAGEIVRMRAVARLGSAALTSCGRFWRKECSVSW